MQFAVALLAVTAFGEAPSTALPQTLSAPTCVACEVDADRVRAEYSDDEWEALAAGRVFAAQTDGETQADAGTVEAAGIIPRSPSAVWQTLVDFESRVRFVSNLKDIHVVRVEGNRVWIAEHLRYFLVDVRYTVTNTLDPANGTMRWELDESVPHDIVGTRGVWRLTPVADGRQTLLTYRAWVDTGRHLPHVVEHFLLEQSLPNAIKDMRNEVERRTPKSAQ